MPNNSILLLFLIFLVITIFLRIYKPVFWFRSNLEKKVCDLNRLLSVSDNQKQTTKAVIEIYNSLVAKYYSRYFKSIDIIMLEDQIKAPFLDGEIHDTLKNLYTARIYYACNAKLPSDINIKQLRKQLKKRGHGF